MLSVLMMAWEEHSWRLEGRVCDQLHGVNIVCTDQGTAVVYHGYSFTEVTRWTGFQSTDHTHTVSGCTVQCTLCILFVVHTTHWEIFMCTFSTHTHTNTVWYLKRIHILSSSYASVKTAETTSINIQNEFFFWKLFGLFLNFYVFFWTLIFSLSVLVFK